MNNKMVYLHFSYYDDGSIIHHYYQAKFSIINQQLIDLLNDDLPQTEFELSSKPFNEIALSNRYVKLF